MSYSLKKIRSHRIRVPSRMQTARRSRFPNAIALYMCTQNGDTFQTKGFSLSCFLSPSSRFVPSLQSVSGFETKFWWKSPRSSLLHRYPASGSGRQTWHSQPLGKGLSSLRLSSTGLCASRLTLYYNRLHLSARIGHTHLKCRCLSKLLPLQ